MKIVKAILIILVLLFLGLKIFNFFSTPNIKIINKTHIEIRSDSLQYIENGKEPSEKELMSWKYSADLIAPFHTETRRLDFDKRFVKEPVYFSVGV